MPTGSIGRRLRGGLTAFLGIVPEKGYVPLMTPPPDTRETSRLRAAGLRPTRQRRALAGLLFDAGKYPRGRHVTAEDLHAEALRTGVPVSLATVYNTLHQFSSAGLLREVVVHSGPAYFDTNTRDHHHLYYEDTGELADVDAGRVRVSGLPKAPKGTVLSRVDIVMRVRRRSGSGR